jgi:hypothetical protein
VGFSAIVVFAKAPLSVAAMITDAAYPADTVIAGIAFRPEFTELQVVIINVTDRSYDDIDLVIRPTEAVAAIAQLSNVPNVSFQDKNGQTFRLMNRYRTETTAIPLDLVATDAGYRVRCPRLPAKSSIHIIMALADIKWNPPTERPQRSLKEQMLDKDFLLRVKYDDFSAYWIGHKNGDIYAPRPNPQWVWVEGEYTSALHTHSIAQKIEIEGKISVWPQ